MNPNEKPTVAMPHVDPNVAARNPAAARYAAEVAARQGKTPPPPKYQEPRGGGEAPPIPLLNSPFVEGMPMADQARSQRTSWTGAPLDPQMKDMSRPPEGFFTASAQPTPPATTGLANSDLLPELAHQDPMFVQGHGSQFAVNQHPSLAQKYGVIRNGRMIPPQMLNTGRPGLTGKTVEGLEALQAFNAQRRSAESGDTTAEHAAQEGPGGAAARVANTAGSEDVTPVSKSEVEQAVKNMDEFDFNTFREMMMKDLLNNDEQRKIIEERVTPLDLSDLIINGRVKQVLPIIPGKYEPEIQSVSADEDLALKRLLMKESELLNAPDRYMLDKYSLMVIALGLVAINKKPLPTHLDSDGNWSDELFWAKFNRIMKFPFHMIASVGVHYYWFDIRVRKLFVVERLKNG